jgi:hypothetical protein
MISCKPFLSILYYQEDIQPIDDRTTPKAKQARIDEFQTDFWAHNCLIDAQPGRFRSSEAAHTNQMAAQSLFLRYVEGMVASVCDDYPELASNLGIPSGR